MSTFNLDDLLVWSERLSDWQRDALRRVLIGDLTDTDISELTDLVRVNRGLLQGDGMPPCRPATNAHVRASGPLSPSISLIALREITYVNALASGPVTFAPEGLTVVYGENASGKSSIARILKKTGRARSPGGPIRPSVFDPDPRQPASATIEFRVGTAERSFHWVDGVATDEELTRINVFDASGAAVQVTESTQLTYTPEILKVFQDLAQVCQAVAAQLKTQKEVLEKAQPPEIGRLSLRSDTPAGILIARLSGDTERGDIDRLCDLTDQDRRLHSTLTRTLQDNPTRQADLLGARESRLKALVQLTIDLQEILSETAFQSFQVQLSSADIAEETARAAQQAFASNSALAGIGTASWKELWQSARRYSEALVYPTESFPVIRDDALCVLCQQPIATTAGQRLNSFERFIQDDVQQRAEKARADVRALKAKLETLAIPLSGTLIRDTALRGTPAAESTKAFIVAAKLRRRYLLCMANGMAVMPSGDLPPRPDLSPALSALTEESRRLRAAGHTDQRRAMEKQLAELDDRFKIAPLKSILYQEVLRLESIDALERARNDCDTTRITRKGGEAAQTVVTARMRSAFVSNLTQLGFYSTPVEVKLGPGTVGQHPYYLSLIARADVRPSEVLSEGEKTCVALAGFLAELETTNTLSGIVLDDPVSSLDHNYRERVARRLVEAAKQRQVIVFTHDIVFFLLLTTFAQKAGVQTRETSLNRGGSRHGVPEQGPPWAAMPVSRRMGVLNNDLQAAEASLRSTNDRSLYEQKARALYVRLRATWERAIEELLLNGVVVRFGVSVQTQRLKELTDITAADIQTVDSEMTHCSKLVHDESGAVNAGIPDPPVIRDDIKRLDMWVTAMRKRRR